MPKGSAYSVISPVVKDKSGDISDYANYHPIALVTIFSKILEHIIVSCVDKYLVVTHNQFGFKHHGTLMPVLILKDIVHFYISHGSNMHLAFIDVVKLLTGFDMALYLLNYPSLFLV